MQRSVAIVHDAAAAQGRSDSSDTLLEAEAIAATLSAQGYDVATLPVGLDLGALGRALRQRPPHVVVNLVESLEGQGRLVGVVPVLLESLGVPFTGCSGNALTLTSDKLHAKEQLRRAGIATPATFATDADATVTWIVKSVFEHASLGIDDRSIVQGAAAVAELLDARAAEFGGRWFAERFVPGRELNVAIIAAETGPRALPVAEIRFEGFPAGKPAIVGYAAKWHADSFEYRSTPRSFGVEPELSARVTQLALQCWELFALDGYARVDFRVDSAGTPWVLEVNANPCLSPDAGFAAALAEGGIAYSVATSWLVDDARRRAVGRRRSAS